MGARGRGHFHSLAVVALALGCAAHVGPVAWAIGDAHVATCPATAGPDCREEVKGGKFSSVFGAFLGRLVDAASSVFGGDAPSTIVVQPAPAP